MFILPEPKVDVVVKYIIKNGETEEGNSLKFHWKRILLKGITKNG